VRTIEPARANDNVFAEVKLYATLPLHWRGDGEEASVVTARVDATVAPNLALLRSGYDTHAGF
jgi:hypothetical protein